MRTPIYTGIFQSDLDAAGYRIAGLPTPVDGDEAANKSYVDAHTGGGGGGGGFDENTFIATDVGLVGDGVTDNTAALQAWIDSVAAAGVDSTLLVPDGIYIFSGSVVSGGGANAQIVLPNVPITQSTYSITIKGYHPISYVPWPDVSMPEPGGPIFRSTLAGGAGGNFIGGIGDSGGITPNLSFMAVCLEDMIFQTIPDPLISCLDLSHYSVVEMRGDVLIMAGTGVGSSDTVEPAKPDSYGLKLPPNNSGIVQRIENLNISNFYIGCLVGELSHIINIVCQMCYYALEFRFAYHVSLVERIVDWWCKNGIIMAGAHTFQINQYDVERGAAAHWYTRVYDVDDATNLARADIVWWTVTTGVGAQDVFTRNGGANVNLRRAGSAETVSYTVTTLPASPTIGQTAVVTDGTGALAWGATVTAGGSTKYLVWYSGTNWTVMGK